MKEGKTEHFCRGDDERRDEPLLAFSSASPRLSFCVPPTASPNESWENDPAEILLFFLGGGGGYPEAIGEVAFK